MKKLSWLFVLICLLTIFFAGCAEDTVSLDPLDQTSLENVLTEPSTEIVSEPVEDTTLQTEPTQTTPPETKPAITEPVVTEPKETEPPTTEPAVTEPEEVPPSDEEVPPSVEEVAPQDKGEVWIPTRGGKKYHSHAGCSNMIEPQFVSLKKAKNLGFTACKRCYG